MSLKIKNPKLPPAAALPGSPVAALQALIRLSQSLLTLAEKETQALLLNDMLAFALLQHEKEKLAGDYAKASEEFRSRLEEFRNADRMLLGRLERLQKEMAEKASGNNMLIDQMYQRAQIKAREGVKAMNTLSAGKRIRLEKANDSTTGEGVQT